jgi:CBS domain containing-hemolysin-like protein
MVLGLSLAVLFIALNGFFVAAEFALVKLRATRGSRRHGTGWREAIVQQAIERLDKYLSVTQLGITLASLGLGWLGQPAMTDLGNRIAVGVAGHKLGIAGEGLVVGVAFVVLTFAHVLLGELVPKLVAIQRSNDTALVVIPLLRAMHLTLSPVLWLLQISSRAVLKIIGLPFNAYSEAALSEDEILGILAANVARGPMADQRHDLLRRVMRFSGRTAKSAMIPRVDVAALPIDTAGPQAFEFVRQQQYSRVLLTKGSSLDDVVGYLYVKDFLLQPDATSLQGLASLRRDALFVPETQGLVDALRNMQRTHTPFAVVVDEYGGTSGIVTMEDLLEEIVGEISDELDTDMARIEKKADGWEVDSQVTLDELAPTSVEAEGHDRNEMIGAVVMAKLQRLPRMGDKVDLGGTTAEVITVSRRRITRVRIRPKAND